MSETPAVSVVIPLYNKGPYIARALNSVLAQTFQDFEIIVVDDGSTDDGASIANAFDDSRIRLIQQENQGVSAARNRGIEASRAELIAFLDADDEWLPEFLEMMIEIRAEYPHAGAYISGYKILSPSRQYVDMNIPGIPETQQSGIMPSYFQSAASGAFPVRSSNVMIPKDVFNAVGKFPVGEWWGEDSDMWGRIALKFSIAYHVKTCSIYHEDVVDRTCNIIQEVVEHPFIATANDALSANTVPDCIIQDLLEYMAREQLQTAGRNLQAGRPDLARKNVQNCRTKGLIREKYWVLLWTFVPPKVFMALKRWKSEISQKLQKRTSFDSASSDIA